MTKNTAMTLRDCTGVTYSGEGIKSGQRRITFASICQSQPGVVVVHTP